jgi:hypothetical protein
MTAARPPVSGRSAIGPRSVKRSYARPSSGASVLQLKTTARCCALHGHGREIDGTLERSDFRGSEHRQPRRPLQPLPQGSAERLVLDRVTERWHVFFCGMDARCAEALFRDVNRTDRLHVAFELPPQAEPGENLLRAVGKRRDTRIEAGLRESLRLERFDEHDVERDLGERARQRRADCAAARDEHVAIGARPARHAAALMCRSISRTVVGMPRVSTSGPSRVTCTSSSTRIPIPRQRLSTLLSLADT